MLQSMDDFTYKRLNFDYHYHSQKEHLKMSTITQFWLRNVVKSGKYSPAKFANFVYICITRVKNNHF